MITVNMLITCLSQFEKFTREEKNFFQTQPSFDCTLLPTTTVSEMKQPVCSGNDVQPRPGLRSYEHNLVYESSIFLPQVSK